MILTRGPDDVCLGDWFLLTEDRVERFPHAAALEERFRNEDEPMRSFFVHWSLLDDAERARIFKVV